MDTIDKIFYDLHYELITEKQAKQRVLDLFAVSTRTFKVGDNVKWRGMDLIVVEVGVNEILIATSENVDDGNYNDWWVGTQYVC
jgi:hypothetical protein